MNHTQEIGKKKQQFSFKRGENGVDLFLFFGDWGDCL